MDKVNNRSTKQSKTAILSGVKYVWFVLTIWSAFSVESTQALADSEYKACWDIEL